MKPNSEKLMMMYSSTDTESRVILTNNFNTVRQFDSVGTEFSEVNHMYYTQPHSKL